MHARRFLLAPVLLALAVLAAPERTEAQSRRKAESSVGVRLGGFTAVNSAGSGSFTGVGGGGYMMFDIPGLLADVSLDAFGGQDDARLVWGGLGAYWPVVDGETLPYVGGGLKVGWARFGGDGAFGLMPYLSIGALIGRSWSPNVRVDVSVFVSTATERVNDESDGKHPAGLLATFGMGF